MSAKLQKIDVDNTPAFEWNRRTYRRDRHVETYFRRMLFADVRAIYATRNHNPTSEGVTLDAAALLVFLPDGRVTHLEVSEWLTITPAQPHPTP
jgi:hypothetical protein